MKALSVVLVVLVIALTGFSVWQFIEAREVKAELADMQAETQSVAAELAELESTLVAVFEIDELQALHVKAMITGVMLMSMNWADWGIAVSEGDWEKAAIHKNRYDELKQDWDDIYARYEQLSEDKSALLTGGDD